MVAVIRYFRGIILGLYSLTVGMGVTFRGMFLTPVTVRYPRETLRMFPRFRGHVELIWDGETGQPNCVVCLMCQKACPSRCIAVEGEKPEGAKRKFPTRYILDFTTCSLCGLCVESCKFNALRFSKAYNLAGTRKEAFIMDLLHRKKPEAAPCS